MASCCAPHLKQYSIQEKGPGSSPFLKKYRMERFNIFNLVHKGLRAALYQTAMQLQQTDFTSDCAVENAVESVREIILLFEAHASKEDQYLMPAIDSYEPSVAATFEAEHVQDERLGLQLEGCAAQLESAGTLLQRNIAGRALNTAFTAFVAFNLDHMNKEEDIINKILWRYYSDDEIRRINGAIVANVEPWIMDFNMKWMLRGVNNTEAWSWMKAVESSAPPVHFQTLMQKAEREWTRERFEKVTGMLSEGLMIA